MIVHGVNGYVSKRDGGMTVYLAEKDKQEEKVLQRRGHKIYLENPFMTGVQVKTRRITNKRGNMMLVNADTGEVGANIAGFWETEEVDATRFVKLFINGVKALAELTNAGARVFEYLYLQVQENIGKDQIFLSHLRMKQVKTISESTYTRGMRELLAKGFVAPTEIQGWFWVNPDYIWNGDRLDFYKRYTKVSDARYRRNQAKLQGNRTIDMFDRPALLAQNDP